MRRHQIVPRRDWERKVTEHGLVFHHAGGEIYWDESAYYSFTAEQIDELEDATNELHRLCLEAVDFIIKSNRFGGLQVPFQAIPLIKWSWENDQPSLYGRMDLAYNGVSPPKLLEYNADTPTSLLESSVVQWFWLQDCFPSSDQFNSVHERLTAKWATLSGRIDLPIHFGYVEDALEEDWMTVTYLRDTVEEAGLSTIPIRMQDIGWDPELGFVDLEGNVIRSLFKLYPWEWLLAEEFGPLLVKKYREMVVIEPVWKMLLSNKGILPILWELYPGHPNLLEARFDNPDDMKEYVRKPLLGREGGNVKVVTRNGTFATDGTYGSEGYVYQALAPLPQAAGRRAVVGSWLIDGQSAGIGIRETDGWVTGNLSTFVPHLIE